MRIPTEQVQLFIMESHSSTPPPSPASHFSSTPPPSPTSQITSQKPRPTLAQRSFYLTYDSYYELFSPIDLQGVSCTVNDYFQLDHKRFEIDLGTIYLREMGNNNQPTYQHKTATENIQQMDNNKIADQRHLEDYYAYQEETIDPKVKGTNVRVADVQILKRHKNKSELPTTYQRYTCPSEHTAEAAIEVVSAKSCERD